MKHAQELDPLSLLIRTNTGQILYYARRYDEAIGQLKEVLELDPDYGMAHEYLGQAYLGNGRCDEAIGEFQKSLALSGQIPELLANLGYAYAVAGRRDEARRTLDELNKSSKRAYVSPYLMARIHIGLGQADQALARLEKAYAERDSHIVDLTYDPTLDPLRSTPRYTALLRRLGLDQ